MIQSDCINNIKEKLFLWNIMGYKSFSFVLLYKGSRDGWENKDFHFRCNRRGPTLCLFKLTDGKCIGGFTCAQWTPYYCWAGDVKAMLFNLTDQMKFDCDYAEGAIFCGRGPFFGNKDLHAKAPFNDQGNCESASNGYYNIGRNKETKTNRLTGVNGKYFTIVELEVWELNSSAPKSKKVFY